MDGTLGEAASGSSLSSKKSVAFADQGTWCRVPLVPFRTHCNVLLHDSFHRDLGGVDVQPGGYSYNSLCHPAMPLYVQLKQQR